MHGRRRRRVGFRDAALCVFVVLAGIGLGLVGADEEQAEDDILGTERRIAIEADRQARMSLEDAHALESTPKEIFVHCPERPLVQVVDLPAYAVERNECLVFHVSAPDLDARLVVRCSGEFDGDSSFYPGDA